MSNQYDIFVHQTENSPVSQSYLNDNYTRLSNQANRVLEILMSGEKMQTCDSYQRYNISGNGLPRRCKDIRESGYRLTHERWKNGFIIYEMTEADKAFNTELAKLRSNKDEKTPV